MKKMLIFLLPVLLLAVSCKRKQAIWETEWQAPLLRDTLTLDKLITEDSLITVNGFYLEVSFDKTIYELKLSDVVQIPDTTINHSYAVAIAGLTVPPGSSFVNNVKEHVIGLGDIELKKIRVETGGITLRLLNPIETNAFFTIEMPGVTQNGVTLSQNFTAPAGTNANPGVVTGFIDLAGCELDLRGADFGSFNRIQSKMLVTSDPQGPSVVIGTDDSLEVLFTMENVKLNYARGYFGNEMISDTIVEHIEALSSIDGGMLDLPAATLNLTITNGLKVAAKAKITHVKNTNNQGNTVTLSNASIGSWLTINSAVGTEANFQSSVTGIELDGNNSNLEQFIENHGAASEIGFQLQLNPWGNTSGGYDEIFPNSVVKVDLAANMPISVGLSDLIIQDTFDFTFKQDLSKTHIESGVMWMDATNAFPLSGEVTLYLMNSAYTVVAAIDGTSDVVSSVYGELVNGIQQKKSKVNFVIPQSAMESLGGVTHLCLRLKLNTPNEATNASEQVQVPANGFFGFKIGAKLKVESRI